jgi:hypothetical protein
MLYSKIITLDKERTLKLGMRETIKLLDKGIDIFDMDINPKIAMDILTVGLQREDKDLTLDKLIDIFDECEISYVEISEIIVQAVALGMGKKELEELEKNE